MIDGIVLVHGGMHGGWCWDKVRPLLTHPSIAPDLPGRGTHPRSLLHLGVEDLVSAVASEIASVGWRRVMVVAHSMGGLTALALAAQRPQLVTHVVFVSALTLPPGTRPIDSVPQPLRSYVAHRAKRRLKADGSITVPRWLARRTFCSDLGDEAAQDVLRRLVPEAAGILLSPTPATPMPASTRRTCVRLTADRALRPRAQDRLRRHIEPARVVELAAGHDAMISAPAALAAIINEAAAISAC